MGTSVPAGWVFTASIPSWTQTTLEGDEVVVVSLASAPLPLLGRGLPQTLPSSTLEVGPAEPHARAQQARLHLQACLRRWRPR